MSFLKYISDSKKGQTVIETVFMLLVLLIIFFMIAEFARAWYVKNSLNNAARVGARVAVVAIGLTEIPSTQCDAAGTDPTNPVDAACESLGYPADTTAKLTIDDTDPSDGEASQGEKVTVSLTSDFSTIVPSLLPFIPDTVVAEASMRHE